MQESYREGVANHPGPEPCGGGRKDQTEAWDGGFGGLVLELRNRVFQDAHGDGRPEGKTTAPDPLRGCSGPAESKTPSMQRNSMRENRETPLPPAAATRAGR